MTPENTGGTTVAQTPTLAEESAAAGSDASATSTGVSGSEPAIPTGEPPSPADATTDSGDGPPATQRIIVGATAADRPADALVLNSLAAACLQAAALGIETIELHFNETREERPLSIASQRLTIRGGAGFDPTIVFRPRVEDLAADRRMIRVAGGQLNWQNIDLRLELPAEPADDWSMFELEQIESLNVEDTVMTICNAGADGTHLQDKVAFVQIRSDWLPRSEDAAEDGEAPLPPYIGLLNCVARGQGTLVWTAEATPFRLVCRQSLLVVSGRLIDVGGLRVRPGVMDGPIDAVLKNVTAVVGQGVIRLSSDQTAPYQLDLVTDCRNSIFSFADPYASFIERRGVTGVQELEKRLFARGRDNFYLGSTSLLRINPTGDPAAFVDYSFQQREEDWSQEQNPRFALMWAKQPPEDLPEDRHAPGDYRLDPSDQNPAIGAGDESRAGADPTLLPTVPEDAARRDQLPASPPEPVAS
jgi:hypothetical protein